MQAGRMHEISEKVSGMERCKNLTYFFPYLFSLRFFIESELEIIFDSEKGSKNESKFPLFSFLEGIISLTCNQNFRFSRSVGLYLILR